MKQVILSKTKNAIHYAQLDSLLVDLISARNELILQDIKQPVLEYMDNAIDELKSTSETFKALQDLLGEM